MIEETARQKKSRETKERVFTTVQRLLREYDYSALTVKNICSEVGIANGTFFHFFKSKDDMLARYLNEGFKGYLDSLGVDLDAEPDFSTHSLKDQIIEIYLHYADYCQLSGVDFISDYYSTSNQALAVHLSENGEPGDIVSERIVLMVNAAKEKGLVNPATDSEQVERDLCTVVKGSVFDWCLSCGGSEFKSVIERLLGIYIDSELSLRKLQ